MISIAEHYNYTKFILEVISPCYNKMCLNININICNITWVIVRSKLGINSNNIKL